MPAAACSSRWSSWAARWWAAGSERSARPALSLGRRSSSGLPRRMLPPSTTRWLGTVVSLDSLAGPSLGPREGVSYVDTAGTMGVYVGCRNVGIRTVDTRPVRASGPNDARSPAGDARPPRPQDALLG